MIRSMVTVFNPWILTDGSLLNLGLTAPDYYVLAVSTIAVLLSVSVFLQQKYCIRENWSNRICGSAGSFY